MFELSSVISRVASRAGLQPPPASESTALWRVHAEGGLRVGEVILARQAIAQVGRHVGERVWAAYDAIPAIDARFALEPSVVAQPRLAMGRVEQFSQRDHLI